MLSVLCGQCARWMADDMPLISGGSSFSQPLRAFSDPQTRRVGSSFSRSRSLAANLSGGGEIPRARLLRAFSGRWVGCGCCGSTRCRSCQAVEIATGGRFGGKLPSGNPRLRCRRLRALRRISKRLRELLDPLSQREPGLPRRGVEPGRRSLLHGLWPVVRLPAKDGSGAGDTLFLRRAVEVVLDARSPSTIWAIRSRTSSASRCCQQGSGVSSTVSIAREVRQSHALTPASALRRARSGRTRRR